jgi:2'-5' RNA ligase
VLTVAVGDGDELTALRGALVAALAAAVGFEAERGPFRPHVTVGRGARVPVVASPIDPPPALTIAAPALTLYRSRTDLREARYEPLARERLGGG